MPERNGVYYPELKPLDKAIRFMAEGHSQFFIYEPGNGTRYEVFITFRHPGRGAFKDARFQEDFPFGSICIVNFDRPCSMPLIPYRYSIDDVGYIADKMDILAGDAWALVPLINSFLEEHGFLKELKAAVAP